MAPPPNCPRCEGTTFYGWNYNLANSGPIVLVYCANCGCVLGVAPKK